jgi:hypothetical protein
MYRITFCTLVIIEDFILYALKLDIFTSCVGSFELVTPNRQPVNLMIVKFYSILNIFIINLY